MIRLQIFGLWLLLPSISSAAAFNKAVMEGLPATGNTILIDTTNVRVGIAKTAPSYPLDILGDFQFSGLGRHATTGNAWFQYSAPDTRLLNLNSSGNFVIRDNANSTSLVTIQNGGNVGIGTTPSFKLDVSGDINTSGNIYVSGTKRLWFDSGYNTSIKATGNGPTGQAMQFYTGSSASEVMRIDSSGKVGIGTTNPSAKLDVIDTIYADLTSGKSGLTFNTPNNYVQIRGYTDGGSGEIGQLGYNNSAFDTFGTPVLTWTSGGNVGIGTTGPTQTLDVNGTAQMTTLKFSGDGSTLTSANNLGFVSSQTLSSGQSSLALNLPASAGDMYKIEFALKQLTGQGHIALLFNNVSSATYQSVDYKFDSTGAASADSGNAASEVYIEASALGYYPWPLVGSCLLEIDPDNTAIAFASCNTSGSADNTHNQGLVSTSWFKTGSAITQVNFSDSANTFKGRVRITKIQ